MQITVLHLCATVRYTPFFITSLEPSSAPAPWGYNIRPHKRFLPRALFLPTCNLNHDCSESGRQLPEETATVRGSPSEVRRQLMSLMG